MNDIVMALDPSGNYSEGKGTTGWCVARDGYVLKAGQICAAEYYNQMEYWTAIIDLIKREFKEEHNTFNLVCEDYRLYASASEAQINSNLETPQLIGVIKWVCFMCKIPLTMQMAAEVKHRWSNEVLEKKNIVHYDTRDHSYRMGAVILHNHSMDAVRHCIHFMTFKNKIRKEKEEYEQSKKIRVYRSPRSRYSYYD